MFGLSVSKILLLALIVGAVVVGTRVLARIGQDRPGRSKADGDAGGEVGDGRGSGTVSGAVDMEQCPACGIFQTPGKGSDCGRTGCPYAA